MTHYIMLAFRLLFVAATSTLLVQSASAQIPQTMSLQGSISGVSQNSLQTVQFRIYSSATGGSPLWSETKSVQLNKSIFNVILGTDTAIALPFNEQYWIGITVSGRTEMTPRIELTAAPYALNTEKLAGIDVSIEAPSNREVLTYNAETSQWESESGCGLDCYIHNSTDLQQSANFHIDGSGTVGELHLQGEGSGRTILRAGDQGESDITYTLPTAAPDEDGSVLSSMMDGTMSWTRPGLFYFSEQMHTLNLTDRQVVQLFVVPPPAVRVDVAITPAGGGALTAWPANTTWQSIPGGEPRGAYAVDWQMDREEEGQVASGDWSTISGGQLNSARGTAATVVGGADNQAYGNYATAMGASTRAWGEKSTAMGEVTIAQGSRSTAMGMYTWASGNASTSMGAFVSTNGYRGSFVYGDSSSAGAYMNSTANDQFSVRAAGGYRFFTDGATTASQGVFIAPGGNVGLGVSSPSERLTVSGNISVTGSVAIGGGDAIVKVISRAESLDFDPTAAYSSSDKTIPVSGAVVGDVVLLGVPNESVLANTCYTAWVSVDGTVMVRFNNYGAGANANPDAGTFRVTVMKH